MNSNLFLNKLNALLVCNPQICARNSCPLYFEEMQCCDAKRFISLFNAEMKLKFENIKMYSYLDDQNN